jgi:DNA-binding transcriptional LysR family regulator
VELTAVGNALLPHVQRLRLARDDLAHEIADLAQGRAGHLRIGISPMTSDRLAVAYAALLKSCPGITLQITDTDNEEMLPALRNGEIDLIFNYIQAAPPEGTTQEHVYDEDCAVFASAQHRLANRRKVTLEDLASERWALSRVNMLPGNLLTRTFVDRGLPKPVVAVEARATHFRLQVLASSNLLTFTSKQIVGHAGQRFRLVALPVKELMVRRRVGVVYRENAYLPPVARRLVEILRTPTNVSTSN